VSVPAPGGGGLRAARMLRVGRAYVGDTATVTAAVTLGADANVWYGVAIRGDDAPIAIGERTNVQDNAVVHVDPGAPNAIGRDVTVGHSAICHGVEIGDYVLVGMGAVLLGGSVIGEGSIVGAGALVLENTVIPPYSLAVGSPARVVRALDAQERREQAIAHATHYVEQARRHADGAWDGQLTL
jgi:carbonic anhydrase/acetyltransferase-like protein (isoleucine patch superfamily)